MTTEPAPKKMRTKLILKIILWFIAVIFVFSAAAFTYGYFYYGEIVREFVIKTIERDSKGIYRADIGSISLNILAGNLTIKKFELIPDTALFRKKAVTDTLSPILIRLRIAEFRIRGFGIMELIRNKQIDLRRIRFMEPDISVYRMRATVKPTEDKPKNKLISIPLPEGLSAVNIKEILFEKGKLAYFDLSGDSLVSYSIPSCDIVIKNIMIDSVHRGQDRLFNADDINIMLGGIVLTTKNGMNRISLGEIGLSTGDQSVYVKNFQLEPLFNNHDYTRKLGFQTDRMDIAVTMLQIKRLNFRDLILTGKFKAGLLEIDSLVLDDYRDKRVPPRPGFKPPMPQDGLRNLKTYLKIDTVLLKGGKATYSEQVGAEPGTIFFDKMSATFTGLTNDSMLLAGGLVSELRGTAYLMGKGKLDATVRFKFGDPKNSFTFSGRVGEIDLREINPMLSKLLPAEVTSGQINKLEILQVTANDDVATGKLLFYYKNLSISMIDKKKTTWGKIKKGVINFVANDLVVNNDNPTASGKMHTGTVYFKRDKYKGIINFLWKSTLSGLKSTMGFNSKAQKEIIKHEKEQQKKK